ncbi:MAG: hypothetical protein F4210_00125 [Holophagales bacterium]|nr:hypothetical protein [Holophagales bacterium]MYF93926.1 hypothetical protein [Holophagales bacterium]
MANILQINLDDLLHCRSVESARVEFKESWNPESTGPQVLRTICAFANDLQNLNGGYIVIGVGEEGGHAVLPPSGLAPEKVEAAQKWIRGNCQRLDPPYSPILSPETFGDRLILVVRVAASDMRPHRGPSADHKRGRYWVRLGAETVDAEQRGDMLRSLIEQTNRVPWDDRAARDAEVEDIREAKVREYLRDVRSGLLEESDHRAIYRRMRITARANGHEVPKNAGLLLFSADPTRWFRGATIEVVQFAADRAGDVQEEHVFRGGLADQLRDCLNHLENLSTSHLQKRPDRSQVRGWVSYPLPALRETLVNAAYHRGYDVDQPEPVKVYLYPGRVEVISYPGPVAGIEPSHLVAGAQMTPVPARNRRIGEFLKELGLAEGRLTGLPKVFRTMEENGSPPPSFDFDEERTYFRATLPAHPEYVALSTLRDAAHLRAVGETEEALRRIEAAWESNPASAVLASEMIRSYAGRDEIERAEDVLATCVKRGAAGAIPHVRNALIDLLVNTGEEDRARRLLQRRDGPVFGQDAIDTAILARRLREPEAAHRYFERAGEAVDGDPRALHEFAQTKMYLAGKVRMKRRSLNRRFLNEARSLLERVIQLDASPTRHAWAWRDLARTRNWLRLPLREVEDAYAKAMSLLPDERRFVEELAQLRRFRRR